MKTMSHRIKCLLFEAYRRLNMQDAHGGGKPLLEKWVGLGTEAAYRPAIKAGLFVFHDGKTPPPRCMGWLCLTSEGAIVLRSMEAEFQQSLEELKAHDYDQTIVANYTLAGGISS